MFALAAAPETSAYSASENLHPLCWGRRVFD
jgi:hypothetical protein